MQLLNIACIFITLICAAQTIEWQNGIQPQIQLSDILSSLKDTILPSFYPKPRSTLEDVYYQATSLSPPTPTAHIVETTDINDVPFLQELDSYEDTTAFRLTTVADQSIAVLITSIAVDNDNDDYSSTTETSVTPNDSGNAGSYARGSKINYNGYHEENDVNIYTVRTIDRDNTGSIVHQHHHYNAIKNSQNKDYANEFSNNNEFPNITTNTGYFNNGNRKNIHIINKSTNNAYSNYNNWNNNHNNKNIITNNNNSTGNNSNIHGIHHIRSSANSNSNYVDSSKGSANDEQMMEKNIESKNTVTSENEKNLFGIPFSIKITKSNPTISRYSTDRIRWRTVPNSRQITTTPAPLRALAQTATTRPLVTATFQHEILNTKPYAEKDVTNADLELICNNAKRLAKTFAIHDLPSFARKNCGIVRMYYPYATCEKVAQVLDYCFPSAVNPLGPGSFVA